MAAIKRIERLRISGFSAFVMIFTFFIYGPVELFLSNRGSEEFWFALSDVIIPLSIISVGLFTILMLIHTVLPPRGYHVFNAIMISLSILFFLQGTFLPNSYGALNGKTVDWSQYTVRLIYNTAIWITILVVAIIMAVKKWKEFRHVVIFAATAIFAIEVISLIAIVLTGAGKNGNDNHASDTFLTTEKEYTVSDKNNTLVFILDCFDAQLMRDLLEQYPEEIHDSFAGFTFYNNTSGGATRTKYAIPYILIGKTNDRGGLYSEYLKEETATSPLFQELRTGRYDTGFYTESTYVDCTQTVAIDNLSANNEKQVPSSSFGLTGTLLKMTAFKYMPHILKPYFWMYSFDLLQWRKSTSEGVPYVINDIEFYNNLRDGGLTISVSEPSFRFYHLKGAHPPYAMDEKMQSVADGTIEKQSLGALRIVSEYIRQLKEMDLYDSANIFIIADHGEASYGTNDIEQNPVCLIKAAHTTGEFTISNDRLSYKDLPAMFVDALNEQLNPTDYSIPSGNRYFYAAVEKNGSYTIYEYASDGDAYDFDSWHPTGVSYEFTNKDYHYQLGTMLYCGEQKGATASRYYVKGFTQTDGEYCFTDGTDVEMMFDVGDIEGNLMLEYSYVGTMRSQRCYLYASDNIFGSCSADGPGTQSFIIPRESIKDGVLKIRIYLPDAYSDYEHGTGPDNRKLGIGFESIIIDHSDEEFEASAQMHIELPE